MSRTSDITACPAHNTAQEKLPDEPAHKTITVRLQNIPLLKGLELSDLERVASVLELRTVAHSEFVARKGDYAEHLYFLLSGRLQAIEITLEGREITLAALAPGDCFGDLPIIDGLPWPSSFIAREVSLVACFPRENALELIYNTPLVAQRVLKRMAEKIRLASEHQAILAIPNAFQRVFALLNQFTKIAPGGLVIIEKMPTQQEIAAKVNTSRETVSRAIQALIQKGVVEKDMRRLIVRQPNALRDAVTAEQTAGSEDGAPRID